MTLWNAEVPCLFESFHRVLMRDFEQRHLCRFRLAVDQIHDFTLMTSNDSRMRFSYKVAHGGRMPVISSRQTRGVIQALLDDGPFTLRGEDERVQIDLEAICDRVV